MQHQRLDCPDPEYIIGILPPHYPDSPQPCHRDLNTPNTAVPFYDYPVVPLFDYPDIPLAAISPPDHTSNPLSHTGTFPLPHSPTFPFCSLLLQKDPTARLPHNTFSLL